MIKRDENQFAGTGEGTALLCSFNPAAPVVATLPGRAWHPAGLRLEGGYNARPVAFREVASP